MPSQVCDDEWAERNDREAAPANVVESPGHELRRDAPAPERWVDLTIANGSLSVIQVRYDGRTRLVSFNDVGHLPPPLGVYPRFETDPGPSRRRK